jgi:hypothetical protein
MKRPSRRPTPEQLRRLRALFSTFLIASTLLALFTTGLLRVAAIGIIAVLCAVGVWQV